MDVIAFLSQLKENNKKDKEKFKQQHKTFSAVSNIADFAGKTPMWLAKQTVQGVPRGALYISKSLLGDDQQYQPGDTFGGLERAMLGNEKIGSVGASFNKQGGGLKGLGMAGLGLVGAGLDVTGLGAGKTTVGKAGVKEVGKYSDDMLRALNAVKSRFPQATEEEAISIAKNALSKVDEIVGGQPSVGAKVDIKSADIKNITKGRSGDPGYYTVFHGENADGTRAFDDFNTKAEAIRAAQKHVSGGKTNVLIDSYSGDGDLIDSKTIVPSKDVPSRPTIDKPTFQNAPTPSEKIVESGTKYTPTDIDSGRIATSRLSINTERDAVAKELTDNFGDLPQHQIRDTVAASDRALKFIDSTTPEEAMRVAFSKTPSPSPDIFPEDVYTAIRVRARENNDWETLRKLATSEEASSVATVLGQRIKALDPMNQDDPVTMMKNVIEARKKPIERATGKKADTFIKETSNKIRQDVEGKIQTSKIVDDVISGVNKVKTNEEEKLAKKVIGQVSPVKPKEVDKLVEELFKIAKTTLPEKGKTTPTPVINLIKNMFDQSSRAQDVYSKAKEIVLEKIKGRPDLISALELYEKTRMTNPVSAGTVSRAVKEELSSRSLKLREIIDKGIKEQKTTVEEISSSMAREGFSPEAQQSFSKMVAESLNKQLSDAKGSVLKSMMMGAKHSGAKQTLAEKIQKLSNYGALDNNDYLDIARAQLKTDISSDEAKEISRLAQNTLEKKKGYDSVAGKWASEKDRIEYGLSKYDMDTYVNGLKEGKLPFGQAIGKIKEHFNLTAQQQTKLKAIFNLSGDALKSTSNTLVSVLASIDDSFLGRQGIKTLFSEPLRVAQARKNGLPYKSIWWDMSKKSVSDIVKVFGKKDAQRVLMSDIYSRPRYMNGEYIKAKIFAKEEEQYPTALPEKLPIIGRAFKASQVAFEDSAIRARVGLYDFMADMASKNGVAMSDEAIEDLGKLTNSLTARGQWGKKGDNPLVRLILWAPKMLKANIDTLTVHGAGTGLQTSYARKQAAVNTASIIAGMATVLTIANTLKPGSAELDPRSSDFGKIKVGNTRFDITGGMGSIVTLAARLSTALSNTTGVSKAVTGKDIGNTKSSNTGKVTTYSTEYGKQDAMDALYSFLEGKTAPGARVIVDLLRGETYQGEKPSLKNQFPVPISVKNVLKQAEEGDYSPERIVGSLIDVFGISSNTYSGQKNNPTSSSGTSKYFKNFSANKNYGFSDSFMKSLNNKSSNKYFNNLNSSNSNNKYFK